MLTTRNDDGGKNGIGNIALIIPVAIEALNLPRESASRKPPEQIVGHRQRDTKPDTIIFAIPGRL